MKKNIKRVLDKTPLITIVESFVEPRTVDVHIRRLRKSVNLKNKKELIRTVRSAGYSLI